MEWLEKYGFMLIGIWLALGFFVAITFFIRSNSSIDGKKIGIGWYLLLGPFALIKWRKDQPQEKNLLNRREIGGWLLVIALLLVVIIWKIMSKLA